MRLSSVLAGLLCLAGCLPNGPPTGAQEAPPQTSPKLAVTTPKPVGSSASPDALLTRPFEDTFDRASLGADWRAMGSAWKIEGGKLCGQKARNRGVWLARRLPTNARIEFEATSASADGDLKAELWGDGVSGATTQSYSNATSYLAIFGGWKNSLHVLARLDEHGGGRKEVKIDPKEDDPRARPVAPGQSYRFRIERADGRTMSWWVDDVLIHKLVDPEPLLGAGHDHLGFNDWDAPVCFDNVKVTPL